jgi:hypothetical protein
MPLPKKLKQKYINRFERLIEEGDSILSDITVIPGKHYETWPGEFSKKTDKLKIDWQRFVKWRTNAKTLLVNVISINNPQRNAAERFNSLKNSKDNLGYGVSFLKAIYDDFQEGFLDDIYDHIESEISSDYMGQAEHLLKEGHSGKFDHVPAAVLAGAVLEKALRGLCKIQEPPLSVDKGNRGTKTLNPLIDDLKKAGVYNELKAKQLRGWAGIRNAAAHGEFEKFNRNDVENMINGINNFLADYMGN